MSHPTHASTVRVVAFTAPAFAYLKAYQHAHQLREDQQATGYRFTNSAALGKLMAAHGQLAMVAAQRGLSVDELCFALHLGELVVARPGPSEAAHVL